MTALPPLPPVPGPGGDGSDWIYELGELGWRMVPGWGRDGWDLLEWPHAAVAHYDGADLYGLAVYEERDITLESFATRDERDAATDRVAAWYWRHNGRGPKDLPEGDEDELAPHHRGPFSFERADREGRP